MVWPWRSFSDFSDGGECLLASDICSISVLGGVQFCSVCVLKELQFCSVSVLGGLRFCSVSALGGQQFCRAYFWIAPAFSLPPAPPSALPQFRLLFSLDLCREVASDNFRALLTSPRHSEHYSLALVIQGVSWCSLESIGDLPIFRWVRSHLLRWELQLSLSVRVGFHQLTVVSSISWLLFRDSLLSRHQ